MAQGHASRSEGIIVHLRCPRGDGSDDGTLADIRCSHENDGGSPELNDGDLPEGLLYINQIKDYI